jgi:hypothetical protein
MLSYNVYDKVRQLPGVVCSEIVAATLDQEQLGVKLAVQVLESLQVCADVLADWSLVSGLENVGHWYGVLVHCLPAAWGQPPVSMALILSAGRAWWRTRNSWSSLQASSVSSKWIATCRPQGQCKLRGDQWTDFVKISFVTAAMENRSLRALHNSSINAVFPEPTGLYAARDIRQ